MIPSPVRTDLNHAGLFRLAGVFCYLVMLTVPTAVLAGRPDYSHLSDAELKTAVWTITAGVLLMAVLGVIGWLRYHRGYTPGPGRFSPLQVLLSVGVFVVLALLAALAVLA